MTAPRIMVALFGPPGQGSFNESGYDGAMLARAAGHSLEVHWIAPLAAEDRADALRTLCKQSPDLLVAHGGQGDEPVKLIHQDFPETVFAITQGSFLAANTACYEVFQEQSAFLAGILAGLASKTGVVAHLSGEKVGPGLKGRAAFASGLKHIAPNCRFVTAFCGRQHDPDLAFETTRRLQGMGADLVFAMIDGGRPGVTRACQELPIRQIGNVLDWVKRDPAVFLASAVADSGRGLVQAIDDFVHGRLRTGVSVAYGLEQPDYVRLVVNAELSARFGPQIADWTARVAQGLVQVDTRYDGPEH